ncbi:BatD family protein [Marinobacter sp. chi1]|uniref:BatD family protein n=1 Tax=Marinobacter suaedae TaxID=3057675 RepID=A0ABT8VW68_9GAMM|nr:BatD family protein [Marinobacter sp. chi1]MDO3720226.1 BatD family protein [Marinobacter sp. chi1]
MVKKLFLPLLLLFAGLLVSLPSHAEELRVEPDRKRLYEGEVLTLTVTGSMKLDVNLSNLFDFDLSDLPAPDIDKLKNDFDILGRNQRYNIQTINGDMVGELTWTYQVAPKRTGALTIPSLTFKDSKSKPVTIEVVSGSPPDQDTSGRVSFIELSADKAELYVQEQLTFTVRLFFSGRLIRGDLSEPRHPNAIIEPLGKQREYARYRDGQQYRVVERRYAIFPQRPGEFSLAPIQFEGQARDSEGKLLFLRDSEELYSIPVKDVPAEFTGDVWLPASALALEETGLSGKGEIYIGDNLTRELVLRATGLPSEALPPLPDVTPEGIRSYPEQPERSTEVTQEGLVSSLKQSSALVPVRAGKLTLPEIRIPWWDTSTDTQRTAVIPARTLTISGSGAEAVQEPQSPQQEPSLTDQETESSDGPDQEPVGSAGFWPWLSLVLGLVWLGTLALWWRSHRRPDRADTSCITPTDGSEKALFSELTRASLDGSQQTPQLFIQWMNHRFPGHEFRTVSEAVAWSQEETVKIELGRLQERLFGSETHAGGWDGSTLADALNRLRQRKLNDARETDSLPPLYPDNLSV